MNSGPLAVMQDHLEERKRESDLWSKYQEKVVDFILDKLKGAWIEAEIQRAVGILRTNAYSVEAGDSQEFGHARLIFPLVSSMQVF